MLLNKYSHAFKQNSYFPKLWNILIIYVIMEIKYGIEYSLCKECILKEGIEFNYIFWDFREEKAAGWWKSESWNVSVCDH